VIRTIDPLLGVTYELPCPHCHHLYRSHSMEACPLCSRGMDAEPLGVWGDNVGMTREHRAERNIEILALLGKGESVKDVAEMYGLTDAGVYVIRQRAKE